MIGSLLQLFSKFGFLKIETEVLPTKRKTSPPIKRQFSFRFWLNQNNRGTVAGEDGGAALGSGQAGPKEACSYGRTRAGAAHRGPMGVARCSHHHRGHRVSVVWRVWDCGCGTIVIRVGRYLGPKVGKPQLGQPGYILGQNVR
jgi:hypothetical protein